MPIIEHEEKIRCQYCGSEEWIDIEECEEHEKECRENPSVIEELKKYIGKCYASIGYATNTIYAYKILDYCDICGDIHTQSFKKSVLRATKDSVSYGIDYDYFPHVTPHLVSEISQEEYDKIVKEQVMKHFGKLLVVLE